MKRTLFAAAAAALAFGGTASAYAADANAPQPSVYFDQQASYSGDRADQRAADTNATHRESATAGSSSNARNDADGAETLNDSFNYPY